MIVSFIRDQAAFDDLMQWALKEFAPVYNGKTADVGYRIQTILQRTMTEYSGTDRERGHAEQVLRMNYQARMDALKQP